MHLSQDIQLDLVWGDDNASQVFAQLRCDSLCIVFRFLRDTGVPQSLPSRIVTCFHHLPAEVTNGTFSTRSLMREAIHSLVCQVWNQCTADDSIAAPDVIVQIYEDAQQHVQWCVSHESSYNEFVSSLLPTTSLPDNERPQSLTDYSNLVQLSYLGGRGEVTVVRRRSHSNSLFVFKGVTFRTFLESATDFCHRRDMCYHEIQTINSLPTHPNIIGPPEILVTVRRTDEVQQEFICGMLVPFLGDGTADDEIKKSNIAGTRLSVDEKALWCFQMASAVAHTHLVAHTFHMDIKPSNCVVDAHRDLVLIDWEQRGAALYTLAPEADGTWDVEQAEAKFRCGKKLISTESPLRFTKYSGPPRQNLPWGRPKWNVFPIWRDTNPKALEAAEVFSLGRTMWMILQQVTQADVEDVEVIPSWDGKSSDIPNTWKTVVNRCMDTDPNKRERLRDLLKFWEIEHHGRALPENKKLKARAIAKFLPS